MIVKNPKEPDPREKTRYSQNRYFMLFICESIMRVRSRRLLQFSTIVAGQLNDMYLCKIIALKMCLNTDFVGESGR